MGRKELLAQLVRGSSGADEPVCMDKCVPAVVRCKAPLVGLLDRAASRMDTDVACSPCQAQASRALQSGALARRIVCLL